MIADIAMHWALDMSGAITMVCILRGCKNPAHQHRPIIRWMGHNPWLAQCVFALLIAYLTVRMVG